MLSKSEKKYRKLTRRVAITKVNLNKNTIISKNNIDYKRSSKNTDLNNNTIIIGRKVKRKISKNQVLLKKDIL